LPVQEENQTAICAESTQAHSSEKITIFLKDKT
jgi:hypothetical protein